MDCQNIHQGFTGPVCLFTGPLPLPVTRGVECAAQDCAHRRPIWENQIKQNTSEITGSNKYTSNSSYNYPDNA